MFQVISDFRLNGQLVQPSLRARKELAPANSCGGFWDFSAATWQGRWPGRVVLGAQSRVPSCLQPSLRCTEQPSAQRPGYRCAVWVSQTLSTTPVTLENSSYLHFS